MQQLQAMASPPSPLDTPTDFLSSELTAHTLLVIIAPACAIIVATLMAPCILLTCLLWKFTRLHSSRTPGKFYSLNRMYTVDIDKNFDPYFSLKLWLDG